MRKWKCSVCGYIYDESKEGEDEGNEQDPDADAPGHEKPENDCKDQEDGSVLFDDFHSCPPWAA